MQDFEEKSFHENPKFSEDQKFFRKGETKQWVKLLSKDLINKIQNNFGEVMKENGYNF